MKRFATLPEESRRLLLTEVSLEMGIASPILEKDFWVCWMLGLLFDPRHSWEGTLVFKGGTALSKVFSAIRRFSEDIDLSVDPAALGRDEPVTTESRRQRDRWMEQLEAACAAWTEKTLCPALELLVRAELGDRAGRDWLEYVRDPVSQSPVLLFHYPSVVPPGLAYIRRDVKLEFGSLTDQRPAGRHKVHPWLADVLSDVNDCEVVALGIERAFWEKATILHAEYHRDPAVLMPDRYSRHYADLAALASMPESEKALRDGSLRQRVVEWKARFFARSWARYDLASPGTFRLVPPDSQMGELERDYLEMRQMFLDEPPEFLDIVAKLRELERRINHGA